MLIQGHLNFFWVSNVCDENFNLLSTNEIPAIFLTGLLTCVCLKEVHSKWSKFSSECPWLEFVGNSLDLFDDNYKLIRQAWSTSSLVLKLAGSIWELLGFKLQLFF